MKKYSIKTYMLHIFGIIFLLSTVISGCMVGPNYKTPQTDASGTWQQENSKDVSFLTQDPTADWWKIFEDPLLNKYIELGIENNKNILTAEANILQARAIRQSIASKLFPEVNFDTNASRTAYSKNGPIIAQTATAAPIAQAFSLQNLFNALFDASWEIDLFGKNRRAVQSAEAQIGSSIEEKIAC